MVADLTNGVVYLYYLHQFDKPLALNAAEEIARVRAAGPLSRLYGIHPHQVTQWRKQALEQLPEIFSNGRVRSQLADEELRDRLYQEIGQLKVELDWLKKNLVCSIEDRRRWIDSANPDVSIARQCELSGLARSSYYYLPVGEAVDNLLLMRLLEEQYTRTPYYGIRRMTAWLQAAGHAVNHKRVARLLRRMGLQAIYPKPRLSQGGPEHKIYPYLLDGLAIRRPNQVWGTDITYIRLRHGFVDSLSVTSLHFAKKFCS